MKLLFIGDTHGIKHLGKVEGFLKQADLGRQDALIHCGDIGIAWLGEEDEALRYWRSLPNKVLVCLGNHENYPWVARQPLIRRFGALGHDLGGNVFAPLHGQTARLAGKSLWFYPGGFSIDFMFRSPGISLHHQEMLSKEQAAVVLKKLQRRQYTDYLVSHDGPQSFVKQHFGFPIKPPPASYYQSLGLALDSSAHPGLALDLLDQASDRFGKWYFGHHHQDLAAGKLRCLWNQAVLENTSTGESHLIT